MVIKELTNSNGNSKEKRESTHSISITRENIVREVVVVVVVVVFFVFFIVVFCLKITVLQVSKSFLAWIGLSCRHRSQMDYPLIADWAKASNRLTWKAAFDCQGPAITNRDSGLEGLGEHEAIAFKPEIGEI